MAVIDIKGKAWFASLVYTDDSFNNPRWKVGVIMGKEGRDKLVNAGIKVKRTEDESPEAEAFGDYIYTVTRNKAARGKREGQENLPPKLYIDGERVPDGEFPMICNGTEIEVKGNTYSGNYRGRPYTSVDLAGANFPKDGMILYEADKETPEVGDGDPPMLSEDEEIKW